MKYFILRPDLDKTMQFAASEVYDAEHEEFDSSHFIEYDFSDRGHKGPFSIILHESTSFYSAKRKLTDILHVSTPSDIPCFSTKAKLLFESLNLPLEFYKIQIKGKKIN